jgi:hypothetical protein
MKFVFLEGEELAAQQNPSCNHPLFYHYLEAHVMLIAVNENDAINGKKFVLQKDSTNANCASRV